MTTPLDPTHSVESLDIIIASYVEAVELGQVPDRQDLLDRHADSADALRAFFADFDRMNHIASPLRLAGDLDATCAVDDTDRDRLPSVRYFGDYELLEEIARGGMGVVYKARQVSLNRIVALKMILAGAFASSREVQRFRAEANAAANLDHPHIVPIFEVGEHVGQQYYSMKFVEGTSLARHARANPRAEVTCLISIAHAVHHAHQHGVLHRDLKPSNVLVDPMGTWFVTDFGLVKRLVDAGHSMTESGQILGTPRYMSPEQAAGRRDLTITADVYSLGVILYERLTGTTPFKGEDALTILRQVRETEPPRPSSIRPGLDRDLETVVLACLDKDPARRYPTALALADDLDRWRTGRPVNARPTRAATRAWKWARRNPVVASLGVSVASLLMLTAIVSTLAVFRLSASSRSLAASARSSQGLYLAAQSELVRSTNPGLALVLALEAADRHPGPMAHDAVLAAMDASYELRTLIGHSVDVTCMVVTPDGRAVITGGRDKTARLWNLDSGRELAVFGHDSPVLAVRLTPDGQRLVTLSWKPLEWKGPIDGHSSPFEAMVRVWDLATRRSLAVWTEEFDADTFASSPWHLLLWPMSQNGSMELSPDGRLAVISTEEYRGHPARIIDLERGTVHARLDGHNDAVTAVAFSPDGRRVATASADATARIWDAATGKELVRLEGHLGPIGYVAFTADGGRVLTLSGKIRAGADPLKEIHGRLWDVESGTELTPLVWPKLQRTSTDDVWLDYGNHRVASFSPDGRTIYTVGRTNPVGQTTDPKPPAVWDLASGQFVRFLERLDRRGVEATELAVSSHGAKVAVGYSDGEVLLFDSNGVLIRTLLGHSGWVFALVFTPDGRRLITSSRDGTARVWDVRTGDEVDFARGRWPDAMQIAFSPDGRRLGVMTDDRPAPTRVSDSSGGQRSPAPISGHVIEFRDIADGRLLATTPGLDRAGTISSTPTPIEFSPDGRLLLARDALTTSLFDSATGQRVRTIGPAEPRIKLFPFSTFSPDGLSVAVCLGDLFLYDTATGRERLRIPFASHPRAREGYFAGVRFSPDGSKLLTTVPGLPVCLWDSRDGGLLGDLHPLFNSLREDIKTSGADALVEGNVAAFSHDGNRIVTFHGPNLVSSGPHFAGIWDVGTLRRLIVLRGHGGPVTSAVFSPNGRRVLTASKDGTARIWDAGSGRELTRLEGHENSVDQAIFSPDAKIVLTYSEDMSARLWDSTSGRPICTLVRHDLGVRSASFSPDGRLVAVSFAGKPALTRIWPVDFLGTARARRPRDLTLAERAQFELSAPP